MNSPANPIPALPAIDVTLALESSRPGNFTRRHPTALASLPFSALIPRPLTSADGRSQPSGGSPFVNAYPEAAWRSLWDARQAQDREPSLPPTAIPNLPGKPRQLESLLGNMHQDEIPWQSNSSMEPVQELVSHHRSPLALSGGSAEELQISNEELASAIPKTQSTPTSANGSPSEQVSAVNIQPTRSGFGRLLTARNKYLSIENADIPSHHQASHKKPSTPSSNAGKETTSQLPASLRWLRRQFPETMSKQSPHRYELPFSQSGTERQPTSLAQMTSKNATTLSAPPLPVVQKVIEHLVQREVHTEIARQRRADPEPAEFPLPESTPDLTSDEAVRKLMKRMQILAHEDRFRLGYLT